MVDGWDEAYPGDDDPFELFADKPLGELLAAPDVDASDASQVFDYALEKKRARIAKLRAENKMRRKFFAWSSKLAAWVVGANVAIFIGYGFVQAFAPGKISDAVMLSWIASTVVETLGIVAIIARHLFPGRPWQARQPTK